MFLGCKIRVGVCFRVVGRCFFGTVDLPFVGNKFGIIYRRKDIEGLLLHCLATGRVMEDGSKNRGSVASPDRFLRKVHFLFSRETLIRIHAQSS